MPDSSFPDIPVLPLLSPTPIEQVVPREPLRSLEELLAITIHDLVNDSGRRRLVGDLYRISRRIDNDGWLRRQMTEMATDAWVESHR
jgi:hypothetical protein